MLNDDPWLLAAAGAVVTVVFAINLASLSIDPRRDRADRPPRPFANRYNVRVPLDLAGILPPIATPFVDDEVDLAAFAPTCERWMRTGLRGLVLLGTNGEAPLIRDDEAVRLVAAAREAVPGDRVLLVGTGASPPVTSSRCREPSRARAPMRCWC